MIFRRTKIHVSIYLQIPFIREEKSILTTLEDTFQNRKIFQFFFKSAT